MKRTPVALAAIGVGVLATIPFAGQAGALPYAVMKGHNPSDPTFELVIPDGSTGTWTLWVNEPNAPGAPVVGQVSGTSGTLSITKPPFCGVLQADAWLNGVPTGLSAISHENTCTPPTTTTTQPPPTTTTTAPPSTTTTVPPVVVKPPASSPPTPSAPVTPSASTPAPQPEQAQVATPSPAGVAPSPVPTHSNIGPLLAYTGINWAPLAGIGSALVGLGALLMRRRRVAS